MKGIFRSTLALIVVLMATSSVYADEFRVMWYSDDYPPLSFVENDRRVGIIEDLMAAVCELTGDTYSYVEVPFLRAMMMFDAGDIDVEPSVSPVWRKESKAGVYTIPYRKSVDAMLFADEKSTIEVQSPMDLAGKKIGVIDGYRYHGYDEHFENGTLERVDSRDESRLLEKLRFGRVDVAFIHKPFGQYMMKINKAYRGFRFGPAISELDIMMRLHKSKKDALPRFNEALRQLMESGEIERILARYR